jgi:ribosomal protein S20
MANTLSSKKTIRVGLRRNKVNTKATDAFKKVRKQIKDQLLKKHIKKAKDLLPSAYSKFDTAVKKYAIHKNTSNRYKSNLAKMIKKAEVKKV